MGNLMKKAKSYNLSRRSFLGWATTVMGGAVAAMALPGCALQKTDAGKIEELSKKEGEWVTAACWHNCGGRCLNKAYVVDGVFIRQKTDDTHPDSPDFPQQRGCARGRAQGRMVMGADRLKYPMKRKNWEPGGGNKELRGKDEWVRISWDEALDIAASEIKRIKEKYSNSAIFVAAGSEITRTLNLYGGYTERWGQVSWGSWPEVYPKITGIADNGASSGNDRFRLRKSKLIILWGANPASSSLGNPMYNYLQAKKAGAKFIVIDPLYTETARVLADEWIPVRPATDTTLILGMAYHIIKNNLADQSFLDTYCIGYDADHMPEGVDPKDNFKDYVLGTYDGTPKTPEWASQICGVSSEKIKSFAEEYAATKPTAIVTAGGPARINNGEHLPHAMLTLGMMTGNYGVPGAGVSPNMHANATNAGPNLIKAGTNGLPKLTNPLSKVRLNNGQMWNAIISGKYIDGLNSEKDIDVEMIYHGGVGSCLNQRCGLMKGIEAHRKVEFVLTQNMFFTTEARYSDVVLPVISKWEEYGGLLTGNREILIFYNQVIDPLFEAKSDMWIAKEIGKRLSLEVDKIEPFALKQQVFNQVAGSTVIKPDGSGFENLVEITDEDIKALEVEGTPQKGRISWKEFQTKGIYQVQRTENDKLEFTSFEDFRKDPAAHKLDTPSGKFEIYSQPLADKINEIGFSTKSPLPKYEPSLEGYENGQKDGYPYQLVTIHHLRRSHSTLDNVPWMRESFIQNVWINTDDALKMGINSENIIKITSRHGSVIRPAYVTERIMPGVVAIGQGAWVELDEEAGIDKAGATNVLNGPIPTGQGHTGYNTCNVKMEKYDKPLKADVNWPQRIIFGEVKA